MTNETRVYKIAKDERMIDEVICTTCGSSIVNVMEIDGIPYGMDCGAKKLGWKLNKKQMKRAINHINILQWFIENSEDEGAIELHAHMAVKSLQLPDPYLRPTCQGRSYGEIVMEMTTAI